jgi:hypothetical protein
MSKNEKTRAGGSLSGGAILCGSDRRTHSKVAGAMGQLIDPICQRPISICDAVWTLRLKRAFRRKTASLDRMLSQDADKLGGGE